MERFQQLINNSNGALWVVFLSFLSAMGKQALHGNKASPIHRLRILIRDMILAAIAIMLGTGLISWLNIDPGTLFANGLLVVIGIYARDLLMQMGLLISRVFPALGDKLVAVIRER